MSENGFWLDRKEAFKFDTSGLVVEFDGVESKLRFYADETDYGNGVVKQVIPYSFIQKLISLKPEVAG